MTVSENKRKSGVNEQDTSLPLRPLRSSVKTPEALFRNSFQSLPDDGGYMGPTRMAAAFLLSFRKQACCRPPGSGSAPRLKFERDPAVSWARQSHLIMTVFIDEDGLWSILIRSVCAKYGYACPEICTPEELMGIDEYER